MYTPLNRYVVFSNCGIVSTNRRVDVTQRQLNNITVLFLYYKPVSSLLLSNFFNSVPYDGLEVYEVGPKTPCYKNVW